MKLKNIRRFFYRTTEEKDADDYHNLYIAYSKTTPFASQCMMDRYMRSLPGIRTDERLIDFARRTNFLDLHPSFPLNLLKSSRSSSQSNLTGADALLLFAMAS